MFVALSYYKRVCQNEDFFYRHLRRVIIVTNKHIAQGNALGRSSSLQSESCAFKFYIFDTPSSVSIK